MRSYSRRLYSPGRVLKYCTFLRQENICSCKYSQFFSVSPSIPYFWTHRLLGQRNVSLDQNSDEEGLSAIWWSSDCELYLSIRRVDRLLDGITTPFLISQTLCTWAFHSCAMACLAMIRTSWHDSSPCMLNISTPPTPVPWHARAAVAQILHILSYKANNESLRIRYPSNGNVWFTQIPLK